MKRSDFKIKKPVLGFSLLELMLVLAIISVITVLGLSGWDQYIMNQKIQKTSVEMQMWMQAGMRYYGEVGSFPSSATDITNKGLMNPDYMNNPWSNVGDTDGRFNVTADATGKFIEVSTDIPGTVAKAASIATMLAGSLPFGQVKNGTTVYVDLSPFSSSAGGGADTVMSVTQVSDGATPADIPQPSCQPGYTPKIYVALSGIASPRGQSGVLNNTEAFQGTSDVTDFHPWSTAVFGGSSPGSSSFLAITTCEKTSSAVIAKQNTTNSGYDF